MMFDFYLLSVYMKAESQPLIFKDYMSEIMPPNVALCQTTRWGLKKQSHGQWSDSKEKIRKIILEKLKLDYKHIKQDCDHCSWE